MKKIQTLAFVATAAMTLSSCSYNTMVEKEEAVNNQWSQVENVYQRRADLVPNLVATVKGYAEHEKETLSAVIEARSNATKVTIDPTKLTADNMAQFQQAQDALSSTLSRLMMVKESYPELKANENFRDLAVQLEGTENRIAHERQKFNDVAKDYNTYIRKIPQKFENWMYGFEPKPYFEAQAGAENAPKVEF